MADFFEIDFMFVEGKENGDAIPLRYSVNGKTRIHVTDGGCRKTGEAIAEHIKKYYHGPSYIDAVIVTHPDQDHTGGLGTLFDVYEIGELWMLRPWLYADELIHRCNGFTSADDLIKRLKELYPDLAALEVLAQKHSVPIREPFQGALIGDFWVMAPTKSRYLDLVVVSEKSPEPAKTDQPALARKLGRLFEKFIGFVRVARGTEMFPGDDTFAENNMSVIQYANLFGERILLTGDAGRSALEEAADYAPYVGLTLPGIDRIQVPHHGSRYNVSTEILDRWLGPRLKSRPEGNSSGFTAVVSAAKVVEDHPAKSVISAFISRGGKIIITEDGSKRTGYNAPDREGWVPAAVIPYPR